MGELHTICVQQMKHYALIYFDCLAKPLKILLTEIVWKNLFSIREKTLICFVFKCYNYAYILKRDRTSSVNSVKMLSM